MSSDSNLERYSQVVEDQDRPYYKQPWWRCGLLLDMIGKIGTLSALAFTAQSILGPLELLNLVLNLYIGHVWFEESLYVFDIIGSLFIISGVAFVATFGSHDAPEWTSDALRKRFLCLEWGVYMSMIVLIFLMVLWVLRHTQENSQSIPLLLNSLLSGIAGGVAMSYAKGIGLLFKTAVQSNFENLFLDWLFWLCLSCVAFCVVLETHFMNVAFATSEAVVVIPIYQSWFAIFAVISGGVFYREFLRFEAVQWGMFLLGMGILIVGVCLFLVREGSRRINICAVDRSPENEIKEPENMLQDLEPESNVDHA